VTSQQKNHSIKNLPQNKRERIRSYIYAEAEALLLIREFTRKLAPSSLPPSKYDPSVEDFLIQSNVVKHCVSYFVLLVVGLCLALIPLLNLPFDANPRGTLLLGILVMGILCLVFIVSIKWVYKFLHRRSASKRSAVEKLIIVAAVLGGGVFILSLWLGKSWGYPQRTFFLIFLSFIALYLRVIMLAYLSMRRKENREKPIAQ